MEELETLESTECPECPGPPPEFRLPPPPRPPFLTEGTFCSEAPLAELEDCVAIPRVRLETMGNCNAARIRRIASVPPNGLL
ncbi:inactive histone-lysine N-methyltransferase 2E isoform X1 [Vespula maculifrons]|uniref:Inactive histone-lysine N-methyltransferase 2E isoform X1 n=1 Tax=Vespula maculifrons TaxID=7453 RepID=A0ABD2CTU9_VESMC